MFYYIERCKKSCQSGGYGDHEFQCGIWSRRLQGILGCCALVVSRLLLIVYNTSIVKDGPKQYEDFLAPESNGMSGLPIVDGSPITTAYWDSCP
jgi:hypothetical protein